VTSPAPGAGASDPGTGAADLAAEVVRRLTDADRTVAVAESLTGGGVVEALVQVPGASACVRGAVVAYATDLKATLLGVPQALLDERGPVDPDVARAMADGVRVRLGADYAVATTGVAGPDAQGGRPPGTFHVAVVGPGGAQVRSGAVGPVGRAVVRAAARDAALALLLERVTSDTEGTPRDRSALEPS
jgi:nicotinamide-nucleotide amidase